MRKRSVTYWIANVALTVITGGLWIPLWVCEEFAISWAEYRRECRDFRLNAGD